MMFACEEDDPACPGSELLLDRKLPLDQRRRTFFGEAPDPYTLRDDVDEDVDEVPELRAMARREQDVWHHWHAKCREQRLKYHCECRPATRCCPMVRAHRRSPCMLDDL